MALEKYSLEEFLLRLPDMCKGGGQELATSLFKAGGMRVIIKGQAIVKRLEFVVEGRKVAIALALGSGKNSVL